MESRRLWMSDVNSLVLRRHWKPKPSHKLALHWQGQRKYLDSIGAKGIICFRYMKAYPVCFWEPKFWPSAHIFPCLSSVLICKMGCTETSVVSHASLKYICVFPVPYYSIWTRLGSTISSTEHKMCSPYPITIPLVLAKRIGKCGMSLIEPHRSPWNVLLLHLHQSNL